MYIKIKENDSPEIQAAKQNVHIAIEATSAALAALSLAHKFEARARFDLLLLTFGCVEGAVYAGKDGQGTLVPSTDYPYARLHLYKKDGSMSERLMAVYCMDELVKADAPVPKAAPSAAGASARKPRVLPMKVFSGNYDGRREAAVAAGSMAAAGRALNVGASAMKDFFRDVGEIKAEHQEIFDNPGVVFFRSLSLSSAVSKVFIRKDAQETPPANQAPAG